jgi:hypothetical protein
MPTGTHAGLKTRERHLPRWRNPPTSERATRPVPGAERPPLLEVGAERRHDLDRAALVRLGPLLVAVGERTLREEMSSAGRVAPDDHPGLPRGEKQCSKCRRWLERSEFPVNLRLYSGLSSWCRDRHTAASRRWRAAHPEAVEASSARRRVEPYPPRPCDGCGETFTPRRKDGRYCSRPCLERSRRRGGAMTRHRPRAARGDVAS